MVLGAVFLTGKAVAATLGVGLLVALVLGGFLWGLKNPLVWVVLSVLMIAPGLGCAIYGLATLLALDKPRPPHVVEAAAVFLGGGAGLAVGGVILLVVALLRCRKRPEGNP